LRGSAASHSARHERRAWKPVAPGLRCTIICAVLAELLFVALMWISTWTTASAPICGPACQDTRFSEAMATDGPVSPPKLAAAQAAVTAKLSMSPFDTGAWLRLAVTEAGGYTGPLNPRSVQALENSYRLAPVDVNFTAWRLVYVFNHWSEITPGIRKAAIWEATTLYDPGNDTLTGLQARILDPAGALAFRMMLFNFKADSGHTSFGDT
jgi:hypothetical protein